LQFKLVCLVLFVGFFFGPRGFIAYLFRRNGPQFLGHSGFYYLFLAGPSKVFGKLGASGFCVPFSKPNLFSFQFPEFKGSFCEPNGGKLFWAPKMCLGNLGPLLPSGYKIPFPLGIFTFSRKCGCFSPVLNPRCVVFSSVVTRKTQPLFFFFFSLSKTPLILCVVFPPPLFSSCGFCGRQF